MKRLLTAIVGCFFLVTLSGCKDSHESLIKEMIAAFNDAADILATIKDKASADAAKPKLKKLGDKIRDIEARMDKLGKPKSKDQKEKVNQLIEKDFVAACDRLATELARIADVPGGPEALKELGDPLPR